MQTRVPCGLPVSAFAGAFLICLIVPDQFGKNYDLESGRGVHIFALPGHLQEPKIGAESGLTREYSACLGSTRLLTGDA